MANDQITTFEISKTLDDEVQRHPEIDWSKVICTALAKKCREIHRQQTELDAFIEDRKAFIETVKKAIDFHGFSKIFWNSSLHRFVYGTQGLEFSNLLRLMKCLSLEVRCIFEGEQNAETA